MKHSFIILLSLFIFSCQSVEKKADKTSKKDTASTLADHQNIYEGLPDHLTQGIKAHGGLEQWQQFGELAYDKVDPDGNSEHQMINLYNRKVKVERDTMTLGFDGKEVWVKPNLAAFGKGSARFYHNLYFYFFGMPFLLADDGINYEDIGDQTIDNKTYSAVKITYNNGVGDSDKDVYIAHFNKETYQLEILLYTVTYHSGESADKYNALSYPEWQEVDGLLVPQKIIGYKYDSGKLGDERYSASFKNVTFQVTPPDDSKFKMPTKAEIDSLKE